LTEQEIKRENINLVCKIKKENPSYTTEDISRVTSLEIHSVRVYLREGEKIGLCEYNGRQELSNARKTTTYVYDYKTMKLLKVYDSILQCVEKSMDDFGVQFNKNAVSLVCTKHKGYKSHKGYFFSHELLETN
jgi:predicted transcriptional regulator